MALSPQEIFKQRYQRIHLNQKEAKLVAELEERIDQVALASDNLVSMTGYLGRINIPAKVIVYLSLKYRANNWRRLIFYPEGQKDTSFKLESH